MTKFTSKAAFMALFLPLLHLFYRFNFNFPFFLWFFLFHSHFHLFLFSLFILFPPNDIGWYSPLKGGEGGIFQCTHPDRKWGRRSSHLGWFDRVESPVHLNVVLAHEARLPGRVDETSAELASPSESGYTVHRITSVQEVTLEEVDAVKFRIQSWGARP